MLPVHCALCCLPYSADVVLMLMLLLPSASLVMPFPLLLCRALLVPVLPLCAVQLYERIVKGSGFPYFVNGAGGQNLDKFNSTVLEQGLICRLLDAAAQSAKHFAAVPA
jgi:hypothetical protein